jgi:ATPase subunit of ABC transporter with duplicated ATPase domains
MSILTVSNVAKSFGSDLLFSEINFVSPPARDGLIGAHTAAGKTTLLRIILGRRRQDPSVVNWRCATSARVRVSRRGRQTFGYLRQESAGSP